MSKRVRKDGVFLGLAGLLLGKHRPFLLFYLDQIVEIIKFKKAEMFLHQPTISYPAASLSSKLSASLL